LMARINMEQFPLKGKDFSISWVVIGGMDTGNNPPGIIDWVSEIEAACQKANIPYFEKNNLKSVMGRPLIQELPIDKLASQ
jgi:protein gp37